MRYCRVGLVFLWSFGYLGFFRPVAGQGIVQKIDQAGVIDWGRLVIRASGLAGINPDLPANVQRSSAIEVAKLTALRHLFKVAQAITIDSEATLQQVLLQDEAVQDSLYRLLQKFTIVDAKWVNEASAVVEIEISLTGPLAELILPVDFGGGKLLAASNYPCPTCGQPWPKGKEIPPGVKPVKTGGKKERKVSASGYTGLIVVAKGLGAVPAMNAKILDENDNEIYGNHFARRKIAIEQGMVVYARNLETALKNPRVGSNPLVVHAIQARGTTRADVIVTGSDAWYIHQAAQQRNFLQDCAVIFVLNE